VSTGEYWFVATGRRRRTQAGVGGRRGGRGGRLRLAVTGFKFVDLDRA
jgi:hypothetical protein